jgi:hypothetical protein
MNCFYLGGRAFHSHSHPHNKVARRYTTPPRGSATQRKPTYFRDHATSTAMPILCVARWRSAHGMIEWMCTEERWNPEVAIIFGAAARYRRATVGSSHNDAHPDNSTLHTGAVRPHTGFVGCLFFISPRTGLGSSKVFEMLSASSCIS